MQQHTTPRPASSSLTWENLEAWARAQIQHVVQALLEAEIADLLGRARHQRRQAVDAAPGYRNGYGKPRRLTLGCGTITVHRPQVRGLEERFTSRILPLFARRTPEASALLPELYLHGLSEGDFDLALRNRPLPDGSRRVMASPLSSNTMSDSRRRPTTRCSSRSSGRTMVKERSPTASGGGGGAPTPAQVFRPMW